MSCKFARFWLKALVIPCGVGGSGRRDLRTPCRLMTFQALYRATVIIDVDVVEPAPRNFPHKSTTTTP